MAERETGRWLGRWVAAGGLGLAAGGALGAVEGVMALLGNDLALANPPFEVFKTALQYALVVAALCLLLRLPLWRRSSAAVAGFGFLIAASYVLADWTQVLWFQRQGVFSSPSSAAAAAAAVAAAAVLALGAQRLARRPSAFYAAAGVLLLGSGAAAMVWAARPDPGPGAATAAQPGGGAATAGPAPAAGELPNVVILLIDTLRADRLSCYGHTRADGQPTSPVIDQVAAAGSLFSNAYAQAPWTRPSVASLFTGLFPSSHDTITLHDRMAEGTETLATMLRRRGYTTAAFSANIQVSPQFGFARGFDAFWPSQQEKSYALIKYCSLGRIKDKLRAAARRQLPRWLGKVKELKQEDGAGHSSVIDADDLNAQALRWLDAAPRDRPLFLYLQYIDPHKPYEPAEYLLGGAKPDVYAVAEGLNIDDTGDRPPYPMAGSSFPAPDPQALQQVLDLYDAEIRFCDREIGRLLAELSARGVLGPEDYLVITADHGEEFYDHQQWLHGHSVFEEVVRVPLILRGPGVPAGKKVETPVMLVDVLPTVADWSGGAPDFPVQGRSLSGLLNGQDTEERLVFIERPQRGSRVHSLHAIRIGEDKLVRIGASQGEGAAMWLQYRLGSDPGERSNLAAGQPLEEMRALLEGARAMAGQYRSSGSAQVELDEATRAELARLGYIDAE